MARTVAAVLIALLLFYLITGGKIGADHNVYLPLTPNTPYIQNILADGETVWCLNSAAHNYPNFRAQRRQTYESAVSKLGVRHRELSATYETAQDAKAAGCEVWHVGRYDNFCSGCAGNIHYALWPIQVNYKLSLGYFEWKTTAGHEDGHAYSLHEQYKDSSGGIGCDAGYNAMVTRLGFPTVMSCGTGVWELQPKDIERICSLWGTPGDRFHACAPAPPPVYPYWDGVYWNFEVWRYRPVDGAWVNYQGQSEWQPWVNGQEVNIRVGGYRWTSLTTWASDGVTWTCQIFCFTP